MTYEQATSVSSYVEGAIKCTYVRFYYDYGGKGNNKDIKHLFSIQKQVINKQTYNENGKFDNIDWGMFSGGKTEDVVYSGYLCDHRYGAELLNMWTQESGGVTQPIVEVRPDIKKEVSWGYNVKRKLARVRIEASVVRALQDYISKYNFGYDEASRTAKYKGFQHVASCMFDFNNLYVKTDAIDWQPTSTDLVEAIQEYEEEEKQIRIKKSRRNLWLLVAVAALLLKK